MNDSITTDTRVDGTNRSESPGKLSIGLMFLSGLAFFAAVIVLTTAIFYDVQRQEIIKKRAFGNLDVQQLRQEQEQQLSEYRWIDQPSGVIGIPVERAMELLAREMNGSPNDKSAGPNDTASE